MVSRQLTLGIKTPQDIPDARNQLRKAVLGEKRSPTACARAIAVLVAVGEFILDCRTIATVEVNIPSQEVQHAIEIKTNIPLQNGQAISVDLIRSQLARAVDNAEIVLVGNQVQITVHLLEA